MSFPDVIWYGLSVTFRRRMSHSYFEVRLPTRHILIFGCDTPIGETGPDNSRFPGKHLTSVFFDVIIRSLFTMVWPNSYIRRYLRKPYKPARPGTMEREHTIIRRALNFRQNTGVSHSRPK